MSDTTTNRELEELEGSPDSDRARTGFPIVIDHGSTEHRVMQAGVALVIALAVWLMWGASDFRVGQFTSVFILAIAISGLNLVVGYSGLLSVGHSAFYGIGAYTTAVLVDRGWEPMRTFPLAMVLCFVVGVVVGLPALRIRGLYLALVTLALGVSFPEIIRRIDGPTKGSRGLNLKARDIKPPEWSGFGIGERERFLFWVSLAILAVTVLLIATLTRSRWGLSMVAARDSEVAAASYGVHLAEVKTVAFGLSGAITGLAGSVLAVSVGAVSTEGSFTLLKSIEFVTGLVIGGAATLSGPIIGAFVLVFLPYFSARYVSGQLAAITFGLLLIFMVFVMPKGIAGSIASLWRKVLVIRPAHQLRAARLGAAAGSGADNAAVSAGATT